MSNLQYQYGCYPIDPAVATSYDYTPSLAASIVFVSLFGLSLAFHSGLAAYTKMWWGLVFAVGAMTEVIGWAGRLWSSQCPYNNNAFLMQISTLIIAPTFFTAGIYIVLGRLITIMGPHTSPISSKSYLWIFCTCDVVSLVIQAVGGGLASVASSTVNGDTKPGTDIMVAGILFQLASIGIFSVLFVNFLRAIRNDNVPRKLQVLIAATTFSVLTIVIRSIYRAIELLQGWSGFLITHERYFDALDGGMMVLAVGVFIVFHPGWLLRVEQDPGWEMNRLSEGEYPVKNPVNDDVVAE